MASNSGGGSKQTSETKPWQGVQPYFLDLFGRAQADVANQPASFFPGQTYANFSPQTLSAFQAITNRAQQGTPLYDQASQYASNIMGGQYLGQNNPYLAGIQQSLGDNIQEQVGSRFAGAGRALGSPGEVQTFERELANAAAPFMFQNYGQERERMDRAASMLPGIQSAQQQADWQNLAALEGVGQAYDTMAQRAIDEQIARYNFGQSEPYQRLQRYAELIGSGTPFMSSSQGVQVPGRGVGGAIGGGMTGAASGALAGSMFGPWGAGIGGGLGLLGGLFSDRRLKRDIRYVGVHCNGLPLYEFRYVWDDEKRVGHMSDDVQAVMPEAVSRFAGFDIVHYGLLGWR